MTYVPAKSIVTYQLKIAVDVYTGDVTAVEQRVASDLASYNGFAVLDYSIANSGFFSSNPDQLTMKIRTGNTDFNSETDVQSIVDHYVYQETGSIAASVIVDVTPPDPSSGTTSVWHNPTTQTGTPQSPPQPPSSGGAGSSFTSFLSGASTGGILGIGLAVIGMVLLLGYLSERKLLRV